MKKLLILILILILLLSGCGIYNLSSFVIPDDLEFITIIEELKTPDLICDYMSENFIYEYHGLYAPDPYTLWKTKKGDCNDFSTFATWIYHYHGQMAWQIKIIFKGELFAHYIGVYKRWNGLSFSDNTKYFWQGSKTFEEVVERDNVFQKKEWVSYKVYDCEMNLVGEGI